MEYSAWPFQPWPKRTEEESNAWWQHCYVPIQADAILRSHSHWRILAGRAGCGKSTAIRSLVRQVGQENLVIEYRPQQWPGGRRALVPAGNHLAQIMALAGQRIRHELNGNPALISNLSSTQREFLRWLIEKYSGNRAFTIWIDSLEPERRPLFDDVDFTDIYPTTTDYLDALGQIEELAKLIQRLGFEKVLVIVDINQIELVNQLEQLSTLFEWLDLMHNPGLAMVAALPETSISAANLVEKVRGRVSITHLNWELDKVRMVGLRHARLAIGRENLSWNQLLSGPVFEVMERLLTEEFGQPAPAGWVGLAESALHTAWEKDVHLPLNKKQLPTLTRHFYARHMPLVLDAANFGVWRGPRLIPLTEQRFNFLSAVRGRNESFAYSDADLIAVAGSRGNIHSLASRIRAVLEPEPKNPVYLVNRREVGGYWLENCA